MKKNDEKLAVIGMGCLFPGSTTPEAFYSSLLDHNDYLDQDIVYDIDIKKLDCDVDEDELSKLDDVFRYTLYIVHEALKDSGYLKNRDALKNTGLIMGTRETPDAKTFELFKPFYLNELQRNIRELLNRPDFKFYEPDDSRNASPLNAHSFAYPSLYSAHALSIKGPVFAIDAACAASLYTTKMAMHYLASGQTYMMVAGGVFCGQRNKGFPYFLRKLGVTPEQAKSIPLDKNSGGMVTHEGGGAFVLKRLTDAVRDQDRIHAVIDRIGWSNDGTGKFFLAPSKEGQIIAYKNTFGNDENAEVDTIDYIECHATGTQVGDSVELDSLEGFYGHRRQAPMIGAVKGNIGHLLTGAGAAGMIKVIMSMKNGLIPATINVIDPLSSREGCFSGKNMVLENTPWPESGREKKAAVSAFGFGGINSHLVISQYQPEAARATPFCKIPDAPPPKTAITGISLHLGSIEGTKAFSDALFYGRQPNLVRNPRRFRGMEQNPDFLNHLNLPDGIPPGFYQSPFLFDYLKNKVHPKDDHEAVDKEMILLKIADEALTDAGIEPGQPQNIATIVCAKQNLSMMPFYSNAYLTDFVRTALASSKINLDPSQRKALARIARRAIDPKENDFDRITTGIGPIIATRIPSLWNFTGPAFKMSCMDNSFLRGLEFGKFLLETGEVEAVLLGVVDNDPILENLIWHHCYGKAYGMDPRGASFSEGAAAIVLKRTADINAGEKVYARIDDIQILREDPPFSACPSFPEMVARFHPCPPDAGQHDEHPGYLEFYGRAARHEASPESLTRLADNLGQAFSKSLPVGYSLDQFGCSQMSGQAVSVIKAALMLHYSYKPPTPKKIYDEQKKTWNHRALSLDASPFYWQDSRRTKSVSVTGPAKDGSSGRILLSEGRMAGSGEPHGAMTAVNQPMLILSGKDKESLHNELQLLQTTLENDPSLPCLAQKYKAQFENRQGQDKDFVMVILGGTTEKMLADVRKAIHSLGDAFSRRGQWQGDNGSFFTAAPLGAKGKIAIVYPPSGLNAQNALYELTSTFPRLVPHYNGFLQANAHQQHAHITRFNDYLKSKEQLPLYMDAILASMTTELIVNVLGIHPRMVLGCSFGELIMYSATKMLTEQSTADLINDVVAPLIAKLSHPEHIRRYFRDDQAEWVTYYCKGKNGQTQAIEKELKHTKKAFPTIKAAPGHIIISGLQAECDRIIKKAGCFAYQLSRNIFVHTPLAMTFYEDIYKETLAHPFTFTTKIRSTFYSTRDCQPFSFTKEQFARNMADCICKPIDFEAVIKQSYDDGARIFIGMDSSDLCAEWITGALEGREALVLPVKKSDITLNQSIQCLIAKLISNRVPVNLDHLIHYPPHLAGNKGLVKPITHNPLSIREIMLEPENVALFRPDRSDVSTDITEQLPEESSGTSSEPAADKQPPVNEAAAHAASESQVRTQDWKPVMTAEELQKRHDQNVQMQERFMAVQDQLNGFLHELILNRYGAAAVAEGKPKPFNAAGEPAFLLNRGVLWDEPQIIEMTAGSLSSILGSRYETVDKYPVRARLPLPPFMFLSRVTAIDAEFGILRPSRIEIEYDVPVDAWYLSDGKAPFTIISESSHCGILLLSYIGVDVLFEGKRRFRALSSKTRILSEKLIRAGETVKGVFHITSFTSLNDHTLVFYTYDLFDQSGACIFRMTGSGGFFTEQELKNAKGYLEPTGRTAEKKPQSAPYQPTLTCERTSFDEHDIVNLQNGRDDLCFSPSYGQYHDPEQIYPNNFKVLSRVPALDKHGGDYGMGWVRGEADIDPNDWIFDAHFKNDPVLPATVVIEGGIQLLSFYAHYIGLKNLAGPGSYRSTLLGAESKAVFRGEVGREDGEVTYECHVKKINPGPDTSISADFKACCKGRVVVIVQGLSIKMISREEQHHATFLVA